MMSIFKISKAKYFLTSHHHLRRQLLNISIHYIQSNCAFQTLFYSPVQNMQRYRRQPFSTLADFKVKINHEEKAIFSQIRRYKLNYLSKSIDPVTIESFIMFAKDLTLLIKSYCQNNVMVAPETLVPIFEELSLLIEDILLKYHSLSISFREKIEDANKSTIKPILMSQLCSNCSQQIKKTEIERLKSQILHKCNFGSEKQSDMQQKSDEQQDLHFFSQVNVYLQHLLTRKEGEVIRNQVQINKYQDVVLKSLDVLISIQKDLEGRDRDVLPNRAWVDSAKEEMSNLLKQSFQDKIPPWIDKMLHYFLQLHFRRVASLQREVSVQTDVSTHSDILELKKNICLSRAKIQKYQSQKKIQENEFKLIATENKALEQQVDYYKKQMNKLLEEISDLKTQNQIIMMKLNNSRLRRTKDHNRDYSEAQQHEKQSMRDTVRSNKSLIKKSNKSSSDNKLLPRIQENAANSKLPKDTRTSIKLQSPAPSLHRSDQKKRTLKVVQKLSGLSDTSNIQKSAIVQPKNSTEDKELDLAQEKYLRQSNKENQQAHEARVKGQSKNDKEIRQAMQFHINEQNVIRQEEGQTNLEEQRMQAKRIDDRLKETIKRGNVLRNGTKHYFSSSLPEVGLKKIPRKTLKPSYLQNSSNKYDIDQSLLRTQSEEVQSVLQKSIEKVYNQLTDSGYLIRISEEEFKSMIKIKAFNFKSPQENLPLRATLDEDLLKSPNRDLRQERLAATRREWNTSRFNPERQQTVRHTVQLPRSFQQDYFIIFTSQRNAYNYETSLTKNHSRGVYKMSKIEQQFVEDIYKKLNQLKIYNIQRYKFICSYLRYPFQMMQNNFELTFLNEMKFKSFGYYLEKILGIHVKCKKQEGICTHMIQFQQKLEEAVSEGVGTAANGQSSYISS